VHDDCPFQNLIKNKNASVEPIMFLEYGLSLSNPAKLCTYNFFCAYIFVPTNAYGLPTTGAVTDLRITRKMINDNQRKILYSKISYFHDLIFCVREVCKDEVPRML
jgi:hypothetical protein